MESITQAFKIAFLNTKKILFSPINIGDWVSYGILALLAKAMLPGMLSLTILISFTGEMSNSFYTIVIGSILVYLRANAAFIFMDSLLKREIDVKEAWGKYSNRSYHYLLVLILASWLFYLSVVIPLLGCFIGLIIFVFMFFLENIVIVAMMKMSDFTSIVDAIKIIAEKAVKNWSVCLIFCLLLLAVEVIFGIFVFPLSYAIAKPISSAFLGDSLNSAMAVPQLITEIALLFNLICPIFFIFKTNLCLAFVSLVFPEYKSLFAKTDDKNNITGIKTMYDGWMN